jgi:hypothetical protein
MTVAELIAQLSEFRQDAEVGILIADGGKEPDFLPVPIADIRYWGQTLVVSQWKR